MPEYYDAPYLNEEEHAALDHTGVPGVGGEQSGASESPIASDFTVEMLANPFDPEDDDIQVLVFPQENAVLAVKIAGDDFPRWLLSAQQGLFFGSGAADPVADGGRLGGGPTGLSVRKNLVVNGDVVAGDNSADGSEGLRLWSPNSTEYRVTVSDAGVLVITEVV